MSLYLEDVALDEQVVFGSHTFSAAEIKEFAAQFDPQEFHLDEERAMQSMLAPCARRDGIRSQYGFAFGWTTARSSQTKCARAESGRPNGDHLRECGTCNG
jgi:acyl dehydratase